MAEEEGGAATAGGAEALSEEDRPPEGIEDNITLSFLDKLKCMMYSKVERDAFLIEKLEKEEKKKAKRGELGAGEEKKKTTLFSKLKSVFSSPQEQQEFLQKQVDEIEKQQIEAASPSGDLTPAKSAQSTF